MLNWPCAHHHELTATTTSRAIPIWSKAWKSHGPIKSGHQTSRTSGSDADSSIWPVILDAFTRGLRGWHLSRSLDKDLTISALKMALALHPAPDIHHSDQGSQYAALDYILLFEGTRTRISMAAVGQPTENGLVERFIRTLKEEHIDYTEYEDFDDALMQLGHWLEVEYMTERIHSALDYLTPAEFESQGWHQPARPSTNSGVKLSRNPTAVQSNSILEAMARRLPLVAADNGPNAELVVHGKTGYLATPAQAQSLVKPLLRLLTDLDLARKMGQAGRERLETDFSMETMVGRLCGHV